MVQVGTMSWCLRIFQVSHCLYDERAVLEHSLSLLLNAEVMKPFVVVRKGFHFYPSHSDEGISVQNIVTSVQLRCPANFRKETVFDILFLSFIA